MASWQVLSQTVTSSGDPQQFFVKPEDVSAIEMFVIAAVRVSGGNDARMPRRVIGTGHTRASARRSLDETLSGYDSSYRLVPSR
jgi:hypothetical protein